MKTCSSCQWWGMSRKGCCGFVSAPVISAATRFSIEGVGVYLTTGPRFSCIHHKQKPKAPPRALMSLPGPGGELAYVDGMPGMTHVPGVEITEGKFEYVYRPCRGYSATLAVEDIEGKIVGWIRAETLGYEYVSQWMHDTGWTVQGCS